MNRRELIKQIAFITGGAVVGAELFLTGCKTGTSTEIGFTQANIALLDEIADTILPTTASSPGAKAAKVADFMKIYVTDCYEEKDQRIFNNGISKLEEACKKANGKSFMDCDAKQRTDFLIALDKEAKEHMKNKSELQKKAAEEKQNQEDKQKQQTDKGEAEPVDEKLQTHYFTMMKQLTLFGYFTSKEGMTKALRYVPVPGKYEPCIDYKKGDKLQVGLGG